MIAFRAEHAVRSHAFTVSAPLKEAFAFFEPEGERSWAPGWDPHYLFPEDGRVGAGMVFTTGHGAEETVWMVLRHEPAAGRVEYLRLTPGSRVGIVRVNCDALGRDGTRVNVSYELTALSEAGNSAIRALDEAAFAAFIASWSEAIDRTLSARGAP